MNNNEQPQSNRFYGEKVNDLLDVIADPLFTHKVPEYSKRLALVAIQIEASMTAEGLSESTASFLAAKAIDSMLIATAITLDSGEFEKALEEVKGQLYPSIDEVENSPQTSEPLA